MRLIARFAQEQESYFEVVTVYDKRVVKEHLNKQAPALISIAEEYPAAIWFERKISDDFGIDILYSNDKRPLVKHDAFPKKIFPLRKEFAHLTLNYEKETSLKEENQSIVLGPTHPYHLESSVLHLFEKENHILHFEMRSFFKYRAIEKMVEGLSLDEARAIVERISAPQTIAYQIAFLEIELQSTKRQLPEMIKKRHIFLLELERIINNLTALSLLTQLIDENRSSNFFANFLEEAKEVMLELTGHRFGFGGVSIVENRADMDSAYAFIFALEKKLLSFEVWFEKSENFLAKLSCLGEISREKAKSYGLVGIMARSSGLGIDRRQNDYFFEKNNFYINIEDRGDALARFRIRIAEIFTSIKIMRNLATTNILPLFLGTPTNGEYYSYVESSAGELMMYLALKDGVIDRFFVRDPSFLNIQILPSLLRNSEVAHLGLLLNSVPLNISAVDL